MLSSNFSQPRYIHKNHVFIILLKIRNNKITIEKLNIYLFKFIFTCELQTKNKKFKSFRFFRLIGLFFLISFLQTKTETKFLKSQNQNRSNSQNNKI